MDGKFIVGDITRVVGGDSRSTRYQVVKVYRSEDDYKVVLYDVQQLPTGMIHTGITGSILELAAPSKLDAPSFFD